MKKSMGGPDCAACKTLSGDAAQRTLQPYRQVRINPRGYAVWLAPRFAVPSSAHAAAHTQSVKSRAATVMAIDVVGGGGATTFTARNRAKKYFANHGHFLTSLALSSVENPLTVGGYIWMQNGCQLFLRNYFVRRFG